MNESELVELYAKTWNTLNPSLIEPYLADDVVYESQVVFNALVGREAVFAHLQGKMRTIKKTRYKSDVFAEIGYCGSQDGNKIQVLSVSDFRPCVLMAQGNPDEVIALVLLETEAGKIKRIDICTEVPHPSTAMRTGEYPE